MGFNLNLGQFFAGMGEAAIEIEENVRKRNEKIIDTELERWRTTEEKNRELREASQQEYDQLAKILNDLPGMNSAKTYAVLNYGPEVAKNFIEKAPIIARQEKLQVGDYVDLMDKDAIDSSLNINTLIRAGKLPGMPASRPFSVPKGLLEESPIFKRDSSGYADRMSRATVIEEQQQQDIALPQGKIKFMELLGEADKKVPYLSGQQVITQLTEQFYRDYNVGYVREANGTLRVVDKDKSIAQQAEQAAYDTYGVYTTLISPDGQYNVERDQYSAIMDAYEQYYLSDTGASVTVTLPSGSGGAGATSTPSTVVSVTIPGTNQTVTLNPQGFPSMGIPQIVQSIIQANPNMSRQNANKAAKQLLDELRAKAK